MPPQTPLFGYHTGIARAYLKRRETTADSTEFEVIIQKK
jgi:hypothetical protein